LKNPETKGAKPRKIGHDFNNLAKIARSDKIKDDDVDSFKSSLDKTELNHQKKHRVKKIVHSNSNNNNSIEIKKD